MAANGAPLILHLLPDLTSLSAARTAALVAGLGKAYRHAILSAHPADRDWLGRSGGGNVTWLTEFPTLAGGPSPRRLQRLARAMLPYDLVVTHGYESINAVMARTVFSEAYSPPPLIHHEWEHKPVIGALTRRKRNWVRRIALGKTAGLVVDSERWEERALVDWQQPIGRVKLIVDGIDVRAFARRPRADALPNLVKRPGEVWIGVVDPDATLDGLPRALDLLAGLPEECHLVWATGPDRTEAIAEAADARALNHRVHNLPDMPELPRFVGLFDAVLLAAPDVPQRETVLAAMASGLPVVGDVPGNLAQLVAEPNRPLLEQGAGDALRALLATPALGRDVGEANRRRALAEFDGEKLVATYRRLFDSAIAQRRSRA